MFVFFMLRLFTPPKIQRYRANHIFFNRNYFEKYLITSIENSFDGLVGQIDDFRYEIADLF